MDHIAHLSKLSSDFYLAFVLIEVLSYLQYLFSKAVLLEGSKAVLLEDSKVVLLEGSKAVLLEDSKAVLSEGNVNTLSQWNTRVCFI